jgi:chromate transporter
MRPRPSAKGFLIGVVAVSLSLLAGILEQLVDTALVDVATFIMACLALVVLSTTRISTAWLIAAGVVMGVAHALIT